MAQNEGTTITHGELEALLGENAKIIADAGFVIVPYKWLQDTASRRAFVEQVRMFLAVPEDEYTPDQLADHLAILDRKTSPVNPSDFADLSTTERSSLEWAGYPDDEVPPREFMRRLTRDMERRIDTHFTKLGERNRNNN